MDPVKDLNNRSQEILRHIVDAYCETGEPIGSKTISQRLGMGLSSATIRNIMADLEGMGLLHSPHTSAGRLPTESALKMFVHGFLEVGDLSQTERADLENLAISKGKSVETLLEDATAKISGLTHCAGLVLSPKTEAPLKHVEFVSLSPGRALVIMITEDGLVENRVIEISPGIPPSSLVEASNYLTAQLAGKTLSEARTFISKQLNLDKNSLDKLASQLVEEGIATWSGDDQLSSGSIILRGQANLLEGLSNPSDLDKLQALFETLERKETLMNLVDAAIEAEGVQIFIGAENPLFETSGCSVVISPYKGGSGKVLGAIGVIGPTHINYGRIIPMVDYTAKVISKLMKND